MLDIPLQEIITVHTDALEANFEEFLPLIRLLQLIGSGASVSPEQLATATHHTREEIEAFLQSTDLVVDRDGSIDLSPGPHRVHLEKKTLTVACALDALLFPMLIGRSARVISTCPATEKEIRLTVTLEGIEGVDLEGAVLSLRLPEETTSACNARETICAYGHFFVDRVRASTWPGLHSEAVLLSVEDAAHLAHELASAARTDMEKAEC